MSSSVCTSLSLVMFSSVDEVMKTTTASPSEFPAGFAKNIGAIAGGVGGALLLFLLLVLFTSVTVVIICCASKRKNYIKEDATSLRYYCWSSTPYIHCKMKGHYS